MDNFKNELIDQISQLNKDEVDEKIKNDLVELIHKQTNLSFRDYKIYTRIKSFESALEKLQRKQYHT